jgi:AmmeMemoRadiSam system protein A
LRPEETAARVETTISSEEKSCLLVLAREAIVAHVSNLGRPGLGDRGKSARLLAPGAAFVTVRESAGELRGCIGTTRFERPLRELIPDLAISAATEDRRFAPIETHELEDMRLSISVLTPLEPARTDAIEVGKHGLVVRKGGASGLLLPQVATERGWDSRTFLRETSRKAGLHPEAWREPDARIFWFTAECFGEAGTAD